MSYASKPVVRTGAPLPPPAKDLALALLATLDPALPYAEALRSIRMLLILRGVKASSAARVAMLVLQMRHPA